MAAPLVPRPGQRNNQITRALAELDDVRAVTFGPQHNRQTARLQNAVYNWSRRFGVPLQTRQTRIPGTFESLLEVRRKEAA